MIQSFTRIFNELARILQKIAQQHQPQQPSYASNAFDQYYNDIRVNPTNLPEY